MTKYRIGDHVRVIAHPSRWFDSVGTVVSITEGQHFGLHVPGDDHLLWFTPDELVLAENGAVGA
jgi:hypothetical protein